MTKVAIIAVSYLVLSITFVNVMTDEVSTLNKSIGEFSSDLYQTVIGQKDGNIIMSPLSVQIALSLAYAGSEGETANVLEKGLKLTGTTKDAVAKGFHELMKPLQDDSSLKIANALYVMKGYNIEPSYEKTAVEKYYSAITSLDFKQNVESSKTINSWVESKTNNKIKDLISPDLLDESTRLVLVNAIYFKGFWKNQFKKELTRKEPFFTDEKNSVEVDMMHINADFLYGHIDELNADAIELPYNNSDISMLIILPTKRDGLPALEAALKTFDIDSLRQKMWSQKVDVSIPKFKIEFEVSLKETLEKMGMSNIFSDAANFSGLLQADPVTKAKEELKVSDVIHKAFIDVNEEGAEAAAATGVLMLRKSGRDYLDVNKFVADRPFYMILKDKNLRFFEGRIMEISNK